MQLQLVLTHENILQYYIHDYHCNMYNLYKLFKLLIRLKFEYCTYGHGKNDETVIRVGQIFFYYLARASRD